MSIYAVNGKEPIVAWVPSLDTVGNGTTTLTDLVGTNNGTLINMDAATDWVTDTDAGGVRALDFDGGNDRVDATVPTITGPWTISGWFFFRTLGLADSDPVLFNFSTTIYLAVGPSSRLQFFSGGWRSFSSSSIPTNQWIHIVFTRTSAGQCRAYVNSASVGVLSFNPGDIQSPARIGGRNDTTTAPDGRSDDVRIWDVELNVDDIAYLYSGGMGRGIVASTGKKRPRINGSLINSGLCRSRT